MSGKKIKQAQDAFQVLKERSIEIALIDKRKKEIIIQQDTAKV